MAKTFTAVDLAKLPFPDAVESLDFEVIVAQMLADLQSRDPTFDALVESDPAYKLLEVAAYRELLLRQRVNEAVKAVSLAYAQGNDLEQIAARFNVKRLENETDNSLRRRTQLSFEGWSCAGSEGAYLFHALSSDARVRDVSVNGPEDRPGVVEVSILSTQGQGQADEGLLAAVTKMLSSKEVRPLTDRVEVSAALIVPYQVRASLSIYPGPDLEVVKQMAQRELKGYVDTQHHLGRDVTLSGLYAALHQEGVHNVVLHEPKENLTIKWNEASVCTDIVLQCEVGDG